MRLAPDAVTLQNMAFYAFHGTDPAETQLGGRFFCDIVMEADLTKAGASDQLADTVDYQRAFEVVRSHVEGKRFNLLEALGQQIAAAILDEFARVSSVTVRVRKPNVPLQGILDYAQVEVERARPGTHKPGPAKR